MGGRVERGEIPEVKLQAHRGSKAADWEIAIHEASEDAIAVFTNGGMDEKGGMGAGWYVKGEVGREGFGSKEGLGTAATAWDGGVTRVNGGPQMAPSNRKILTLSEIPRRRYQPYEG